MHFEQVQRKGGWMDYGGNTMEWNPPESKKGWDVSPAKVQPFNVHNDDHWNTRKDSKAFDPKPLKKKTRYDDETFSRSESKVPRVKKEINAECSKRKESNLENPSNMSNFRTEASPKDKPGTVYILNFRVLSYFWSL